MSILLRVLLIEDSEDDAVLLLRELWRGGYEPMFERVDTAAAMNAALEQQTWDVVIARLLDAAVLLKEIHHRVKNNMQVICSLLNL